MPITYNQTGVTYDSTVYTWNGDVYQPTVFPIVGVFIAFDDGPYTVSPAFTEITGYVRNVSTHRGRSDDLEQFDTGTAQIVLDNQTRLFDPFYTAGAYYGKLLPRRQIKIVGSVGGSTYDVFRGYIAGWPVNWSQAGKDSTVTIQAFDALGLMANETLPTDWPDYYTRLLSPTVYFKCNDSQGSTILIDAISNGAKWLKNNNAATQPNFFEAPTITPNSPANSVYCVNYQSTPDLTNDVMPDGTIASGYINAAFSIWLKGTGQYTGFYNYVRVGYRGGSVSITYGPTSLTVNLGRYGIATSSNYTVDQAYLPSYGQPTHVFIKCDGTTSFTIWINGTQATYTAGSSGTGGGSGWPLNTQIQYGNVQEYAIWTRSDFSTADVQSIYNAGAGRFAETTTNRMNRLIGTTSYSTLLTNFTSTPAATVSEIGSGRGVVPEFQLVADSEGGEIYVNKSGVLTTTNRTDVFNATRSANVQATITDSGSGIKYGPELLIEYDADSLKNDVTVNYSGDGEVYQTSAALISAYGGQSTVIETQLADPASAAQLALMELGVEGALVPRISPVDISPNTAATDWQTILGLELLDRVTFKRTPTVGNQFNRDALINAIDHQIEPGVWRTQVTLSMRYTSPLTLDDDVLGTLDFNYLG